MIRLLASDEAGAKLARRSLLAFCVVSAFSLLGYGVILVRDMMRLEHEDRVAGDTAVVAELKQQRTETGARLDRIVEQLTALRVKDAGIEGAIRGRCPECRPPRCPECRPPPCPACKLEAPAAPAATPPAPYRGAPTLIVGPAPLAR